MLYWRKEVCLRPALSSTQADNKDAKGAIMSPLTRSEKIFFVVICVSAIAIVIPGFFAPAGLASGLSWLELPPLHARFVAAIYLFGTIMMLGALLVRQWTQVRTVLLLV